MGIFTSKSDEPADRTVWTYEFSDLLPSVDERFDFGASFRVKWTLDDMAAAHSDSSLAAAQVVRKQAESLASRASILRAAAAEQDINLALGEELPTSFRGSWVISGNVRLSVDEIALNTARRLAREKQEFEVEKLHRLRLAEKVRFVRTEALRDPAAAKIFLLLQQGQVNDFPISSATMDELVVLASSWQPTSRWVVVAQLLQKFCEDLTDARRERLLDQLAEIFIDYGQPELAQAIPRAGSSAPHA